MALFADGRWGQGWNQIAPYTGSGESPLGIAGIFTGGGSEQLIAQLVGLLALGAWGLLWGAILGFVAHPSLPKFKLPAGMRTTLADLGSLTPDEEDEEEEAPIAEETEDVGVEEATAPGASESEEEAIPIESPTATEETVEGEA